MNHHKDNSRHVNRILTLAAAGAFALSGCAVIDAERYTSGGYIGKVSDDHIMEVNTPEAETYRATMVATALMLAAERNIINHGNIHQAVAQFRGITDSLNALYAKATAPCGYPDKSPAFNYRNKNKGLSAEKCDTGDDKLIYALNFQPDMQRLYPQLFNLAAVALPMNEIKTLATDLTSGNFLGALWSAATVGRELILSGAPMLAVGREGKQAQAYFVTKNSNGEFDETSGKAFETGTLGEALQQMQTYPPDRSKGWYPRPAAFIALFRDMQQTCLNIISRLPKDQEKNDQCKIKFDGVEMPLDGLYLAPAAQTNSQTNGKKS